MTYRCKHCVYAYQINENTGEMKCLKHDKTIYPTDKHCDYEEISELLEEILHEFVILDGLYCTDRENIVEKIKTMEEDVIWQIDEQELIKDIANYLEDTEKDTTFEERIYKATIGNYIKKRK